MKQSIVYSAVWCACNPSPPPHSTPLLPAPYRTAAQAFPNAREQPQYRSVLSTARHILATEGAGGFYAGLLPRAFRICGVSSCCCSGRPH